MPSEQWKRDIEHVMGAGSMAEAERRLVALDNQRGAAEIAGDALEEQLREATARIAALEAERDAVTIAFHAYREAIKPPSELAERIAALEAAIEACDRAMTPLSADGEFATMYHVLAGPWHRVLAIARGALPVASEGEDA